MKISISTCLTYFHIIQDSWNVVTAAYHSDVLVDDKTHALQINDDEEPIDILYNFIKEHDLSHNHRDMLMNDICSKMNCRRDKAIIWSTVVSQNKSFVGTFELYEDVEPIDGVNDFVLQHNLSLGYRHAILEEACNVVECTRLKPIIWERTVDIGEKMVKVTVLEDEEVADIIFQTMLPYKISHSDRQQIMTAAKMDGVPYRREMAIIFSKNIVVEDQKFNETLVIYDDGREPIDAINEFLESHHVEHMLDLFSDKILPQICETVSCSRLKPVVYSEAIYSNDGKSFIGYIEVVKNEEPVDAVDRFARTHNLAWSEVMNLLKFVCKSVPCKRDRPVVFRQRISDENQQQLGEVEILDGEEVIDAVVRFIRTKELNLDENTLKNHFFQQVCGNHRVKCTRNIAHIFAKNISDADGRRVGELIITEQDEPADKIFHFCEENGLTEHEYVQIVNQVCSDTIVVCNRKRPIRASIPLNDPDGQFIGNFEVELNVEPVDALYRFFAKHSLFQKRWDFHGVLDQICNLPQLECNRKKAIKFYAESIFMGKHDIGPLIIWDEEEVIDVLYSKRLELNLTVSDQMVTFSHICSNLEVYCERTQAKVFELKGITTKDFEKYGNETCERKYAGWQFLQSVATSSLGSKASEFVKHKFVVKTLWSPLASPLALVIVMFTINLVMNHPTIKHRIHIGHKLVIFAITFLFVAISFASFIEPRGEIDQAMHIHEGRLPDIAILENQEPVDVILKWAKLASKDHHPIVREPIYWDILAQVCSQIKHCTCKRWRAWEYIDMGSITISSQTYNIDFFNPEVEPSGRKMCRMNGTTNSCIERAANAICTRIFPPLQQCAVDVFRHISSQLKVYELNRLSQKDTYVKLGLEMDAPDKELYPRMADIVRRRGMNVVPYNIVGNGTMPLHYDWDSNSREAYTAMDTYHKVRDPESRQWNDKPCTPYFGGALCAKNDKDGNMIIEM